MILPYVLVGIIVLGYLLAELVLLQATPQLTGRISQLYVTNGGHGGSASHVDYQFVIGNSIANATDTVSPGLYSKLSVGMTVPVHNFSLGSYRFTEIEKPSGEYWATHWFLWVMAILWNGVLLLAVKARGIPKRLVRSGTAVFGRVVEIKVSPRPGAPRQIFYEYRSGAGDKIVANDIITGSAKISQGQEVVVLYDPANPRRAILYDFCDFRAG